MSWIFVQIIDKHIDTYTLHISLARMECVPLDCHRFSAHSYFRLPDWRPNVWLVKSVLEWILGSQQVEPICHVARSAKIFYKQFDTWIYFKQAYATPTTTSSSYYYEWSMKFGVISISLLELWFNSKLRNREKEKSQYLIQRKWRMPPKRLVNLLFVFFFWTDTPNLANR